MLTLGISRKVILFRAARYTAALTAIVTAISSVLAFLDMTDRIVFIGVPETTWINVSGASISSPAYQVLLNAGDRAITPRVTPIAVACGEIRFYATSKLMLGSVAGVPSDCEGVFLRQILLPSETVPIASSKGATLVAADVNISDFSGFVSGARRSLYYGWLVWIALSWVIIATIGASEMERDHPADKTAGSINLLVIFVAIVGYLAFSYPGGWLGLKYHGPDWFFLFFICICAAFASLFVWGTLDGCRRLVESDTLKSARLEFVAQRFGILINSTILLVVGFFGALLVLMFLPALVMVMFWGVLTVGYLTDARWLSELVKSIVEIQVIAF